MNVFCLLNRFRGPRERGFKEPAPDSNPLRGKVTAAASVAKAGNSKEGIILTFTCTRDSGTKVRKKLRGAFVRRGWPAFHIIRDLAWQEHQNLGSAMSRPTTSQVKHTQGIEKH